MTELMRNFTGHLAGMPFENAVIYLDEVKTSKDGKSFHFLIEGGGLNMMDGDPAYRFAHYIDNYILESNYNNIECDEIAKVIINILTQ
ncbi:TPA: hypothetical protein ACS624_003881 [Klebsiella michiganensis]|uniref:hypothetical protein n=1 Tax=Klebsiella michiganensis TaxID=1134687 RepID=UPI001CF6DDC5|nr:hypothetical protein [Klebsiella michiganensis]MCB3568444.1 hypothetical protein [Klebsiella michiganensis]MDU4158554.1 hypothetical protein [Klebsiella michiganensis]HCQ8715226.1 hypothetical protein [Klebsiella michiganensis]HED2928733.1 hypothetical protein [Klebsiella michiganensis]